jgi:hypothetical protein
MAYKFGEGYQFEGDRFEPELAKIQEAALSKSMDGGREVNNPIITCIGTRSDFEKSLPENFQKMLDGEDSRSAYPTDPNIDNVSYHASTNDKEKAGLLSDGPYQYVMSPVDSKDKYSSGFYGCLGLVVVGKDKETNENISTMLHTPLYDPNDDTEGSVLAKFITSLDEQLSIIKNNSLEGSIDSVIVGGLIQETYGDLDLENYSKTKDFISIRVQRSLGILPESVGGPKMMLDEKRRKDDFEDKIQNPQSDSIYFENKTRRLFLLRPEYTKE